MFRSQKKEEVAKNELFDIDPERGTITRRSDGIRVMALNSAGWATLEKELATTFVSGAAVILQRIGYSYGRYLGRLAKAKGQTADQTYEVLEAFAKESGWGEMSLSSGDLNQGQARIAIRDCFFCMNRAEGTEPLCNTLVGVVGGVLEEMIGATHRVSEEKCIAMGDPACLVVAERIG